MNVMLRYTTSAPNEVIVNQFLPDDFELSLQLLDLLFANLRVEIPVALCELQLERHLL